MIPRTQCTLNINNRCPKGFYNLAMLIFRLGKILNLENWDLSGWNVWKQLDSISCKSTGDDFVIYHQCRFRQCFIVLCYLVSKLTSCRIESSNYFAWVFILVSPQSYLDLPQDTFYGLWYHEYRFRFACDWIIVHIHKLQIIFGNSFRIQSWLIDCTEVSSRHHFVFWFQLIFDYQQQLLIHRWCQTLNHVSCRYTLRLRICLEDSQIVDLTISFKSTFK